MFLVPVHLQTLLKTLIKIANWLTTWQFKEGYQEIEKEYLNGNGKNEKRKEKVLKKKEKIQTMQRGYRSYRIAFIHLNPLAGRNLDIVLIVLYLFALNHKKVITYIQVC